MKFPVRSLLSLSGGNNVFVVLLLAAQVFFVSTAAAQDSGKILELQRVIDVQQRQNEAQQKQLDAQRQLLEELQKQMESLAKDADMEEVPVVAEKPASKPEVASSKAPPVENVVTTGGGERTKLSIDGWVNRMVSIIDDGKDTDAYFVDNDNAESRVNFVGTAKVTGDLTLGSRIELTIAPNKAGNVDQNNQETNNIFDQRWTEVSLESTRFGKLSLGKGNVAAYGTAAVDLSRTIIIAYSGLVDLAGGMLFRQSSDDALTDVRIGNAFSNFDGLTRKNRVRYDTPTFHGFHFGASAFSEQRYDGALFWAGQGYGFKAAAGAGLTDPNEDDTDLQYGGSFSILHEDTGLNLSLSSGKLERDNQSDPYNLYGKIGWLKTFFPCGWTAFSADYTRSYNLPTDSDDGYSVGLAAVQSFEKFGTEVYMLYRLHSLDRDVEPDVHDINLISIGSRVKF